MSTASASVKLERLRLRSKLYQEIRAFFYGQGFIEVDTPVRIKAPALEEYIDAQPSGDWYLRTSPEFHMKRLIQAGSERIFQIGPCFRRGECGKKHRPEFTMLEWYMIEADYRDMLTQTQNLIQHLFLELHSCCHGWKFAHHSLDIRSPFNKLTVEKAFTKYAGVDLRSVLVTDRFDDILIEKVEPNLGTEKPTFLMDYPIQLGALARAKCSDPRFAERWELYMGGLELANAYSELTDVEEQRERFEAWAHSRHEQNREIYPMDMEFLQALEKGMPECAGCALGVDRLLMILADCQTMDDVLFF